MSPLFPFLALGWALESRRFSELAFVTTPNCIQRRSPVLQVSNVPSFPSIETKDQTSNVKSQIREIRSKNLAGVVSLDNGDIVISFQDGQNLVAISGESGSGKSLLVARVAELLTGGKASATFLKSESATVEIELALKEPFLSAAKLAFETLGLDVSTLIETEDSGKLVLRRTLVKQPVNKRLKSLCQINGQTVTLKVLAALASPLLAVVDATTAAAALSKPESRMAILDTAVPSDALTRVSETAKAYRMRRKERERLENELASRTLPQSFKSLDDERGIELVNHWIDELDAFSSRVLRFCLSIVRGHNASDFGVEMASRKLALSFTADNSTQGPPAFTSNTYSALTDFRDAVRSLDGQLVAARSALDALSLLSSPKSAATAIEQAREFLFQADFSSMNEEGNSLTEAVERSHNLLNDVESALSEVTRFIENDERGLLRTLEKFRARCPVSLESIDGILLDWNSLARKHGIPPTALPSCRMAVMIELGDNVEARALLPIAVTAEEDALLDFRGACAVLTEQRQRIAADLSESVARQMPSLGMDGAIFRVVLQPNVRNCTDSSAYSSFNLGLDSADFLLVHSDGSENYRGSHRGGKVNEVASSGEKARILLAIECALPGSVGATCAPRSPDDLWNGLPPVAVVYDEIDAHVGGRAAVSMANMLADQSLSSQVVTITHSPSVAAVADLHVVIQKAFDTDAPEGSMPNKASVVVASVVVDAERRKELARMASGGLAVDEAEVFADALIREGVRRRSPEP